MEATRGRALSSAPTAIQLCQIRVARCSERAARTAVAAGRAARTGSLQWWLWGEACPGTRVGSSHLALRRAGRRARRGEPAAVLAKNDVPLISVGRSRGAAVLATTRCSVPAHSMSSGRPVRIPLTTWNSIHEKEWGKETAPRGGGGGGGGGRHCCGCRCCGCCGVENLTPHA